MGGRGCTSDLLLSNFYLVFLCGCFVAGSTYLQIYHLRRVVVFCNPFFVFVFWCMVSAFSFVYTLLFFIQHEVRALLWLGVGSVHLSLVLDVCWAMYHISDTLYLPDYIWISLSYH